MSDASVSGYPTVSVVMAVLNAASTYRAQLDALAQQTYPGRWEVVVADNGCTDSSMAILAEVSDRLPSVTVVDASAKRGDAPAKNRAMEASTGEILVSCDADDVVDEGWIEALVVQLKSCDVAGGVCDTETLNSALVNSWYRSPYARRSTAGVGSRPLGTVNNGFGGGNIGCRRTVWEALGGWDENLWANADADFIFRAEDAGYRVAITSEALVRIRRRVTLGGAARKSFRGGMAGRQLVARHRARFSRQRSARRRRVVSRWGFALVAWPAALVSPGIRGMWMRIVSFGVGTAWGWVRLERERRSRRRCAASGRVRVKSRASM